MPHHEFEALTGPIVECEAPLSLEEMCRLCAVDATHIVALVEEGILPAAGATLREWRFAGAALRRARVALRLERDLEINLAGVALALELLDEIEQLRRRQSAGL